MSNFWAPGITVEIAEKMVIQQALKYYRGNKTQTAGSIGIALRTLDSKLEKYKADDEQDRRRQEQEFDRQKDYQKRARGLSGASTGVCMEPASKVAAQSKVSMFEREEIQEVLPEQTSEGSSKRGRPRLQKTDVNV